MRASSLAVLGTFMAGPTAGILLQEPLTETKVAHIRDAIDRLTERWEGNNFWIDGRPFIICFGEEYEGELQEVVSQGLPEVLGWTPGDSITIAAMCNQRIDHELLGRLCHQLARSLVGVVDFGGTIAAGPTVARERRTQPMKVERPGEHAGVLFATSYLGVDGQWHANHYGDAEFLEAWLKSPDFRMVK